MNYNGLPLGTEEYIDVHHISKIINQHFKNFLTENNETKFFSNDVWFKIVCEVDERVADHSRPIDITRNSLIVVVDHPAWRHHISLLLPNILRIIKKKYANLGIEIIKLCLTKDDISTSIHKNNETHISAEQKKAE